MEKSQAAVTNKVGCIDDRKKASFLGKESTAKRYGHIPTAENYTYTQNYQVTNSGNKMRSLKSVECNFYQGYYFARPQKITYIEDLLKVQS